jgi:hypothetical protein
LPALTETPNEKAKAAARHRAWRAAHPDKAQAYRTANAAKISAQKAAYYLANREKILAIKAAGRAAKKAPQ